LTITAVHRLCYGIWLVCSILLYRDRFAGSGLLRVGLPGLAQFVLATAVGGALAALITPAMARRIGAGRWAATLLAAAGVVALGCGLPARLGLQLLGGALLGVCAQGIKICVDTILQRAAADSFRGRVFALNDMTFNLALVAAAAITAAALPADGHAPAGVAAIGGTYVLAAGLYWRFTSRTRSPDPAGSATTAAAP
jgi:MFS family permease